MQKIEIMGEDTRWLQRLEHYQKALSRLTIATNLVSRSSGNSEQDDLLREGLVQRFEYTQEFAWKLMKDYAEYQGYTEIHGSRDAIRTSLQMGVIDDRDWMDTIADRNITSHCYDEAEFLEVLHKIVNIYLPLFQSLEKKMIQLKAKEEL